jgi:HJR/Mrr/RecB family endonuclease
VSKTPFQLVLKAPVHIGDGGAIYRVENGQLFISATRIRGVMRQYLRELFARQGVGSELEAEIFGEVTTKHAIRSRFSLSSLLSTIDQLQEYVVPVGTSFNGTIFSDVTPRSTADFAIKLSLLGIQDLRKEGGIPCEIKFPDDSILSHSFYQQTLNANEDKAQELQQYVDGLLVSYFQAHPEKLALMQPRAFEEFVASMLRCEGFEVELTPATRDGGFDILAVRHSAITGRHTYLIECKRYSKHRKVGIEVVRNLMWVLHQNNATKGLIVTTSSFSRDVHREAEQYSNKIMLHDYDSLQKWVRGLEL